MKDQGLDIVEGLALSKTGKEIEHGIGARDMGVLASRDSFAPLLEEKNFGCW
jgi:hypothetical protein